MKTTFKIGIMIALAGIVTFTSCKKDNAVSPESNGLALNNNGNSLAQLSVNDTAHAVITGNYGTLPSATNPTGGPWTAIPYSLYNNNLTGTPKEVQFDNFFNGNLTVNGISHFVGYKDITGTSINAVTLSNFTSGTTYKSDNTMGENTTSEAGWYNYTTANPVAVANRYEVVTDNESLSSATRVYIVQLHNINSQIDPADTTKGRGIVNITYKRVK